LRTFVACIVVLMLAFGARGDAQGRIDGVLLIGKWAPKNEKKGAKITLEIMKDGKLVVSLTAGGRTEKIEGTYKLDGDKLDISLKSGSEEVAKTFTIKKLTESVLEVLGSKGKSESYTKVKDEKKK
jgi:uncharacterized protein (TIGR03066 family)